MANMNRGRNQGRRHQDRDSDGEIDRNRRQHQEDIEDENKDDQMGPDPREERILATYQRLNQVILNSDTSTNQEKAAATNNVNGIQSAPRTFLDSVDVKVDKPQDIGSAIARVDANALAVYLAINTTYTAITIPTHYSIWAYDGFSPEKAVRLFALYSAASSSLVWNQDLMDLLYIYCTRGSKIQKVLNRTAQVGKSSMRFLLSKYHIVGTGKRKIGNSDLTLPRLSTGFPILTARIMASDGVSSPVTETNLPRIYAWPGGLALIRSTDNDNITRWFSWSAKFTRLINQNSDLTLEEVNQQNASYYNIMISQTFISGQQKTSLFTALGNLVQ